MAQRLKRGEKDKNHFFTSQCVCGSVCVCVIINCMCYIKYE